MTADPKSLPERLRRCITASDGIDLRDPALLREAATALEAQAALLEEARAALGTATTLIHNLPRSKTADQIFEVAAAYLAKTEPT